MGDTLPRYAAEGAIAADLAGWAAGHGYEGPVSRVMAWSVLLLACRDLAAGRCGAPSVVLG